MNHVQMAAAIVRSEAAAAQRSDDPAWLAGAAMCYTQSRVRRWREDERVAAGFGFSVWPSDILASGSGYCGSVIMAWRAILTEIGLPSRRINLRWDGPDLSRVGHVCGEVSWDDEWHFYDVQNGTLWMDGDRVLAWPQIRLNKCERDLRISNEAWMRFTGNEDWFAADPFAYLMVEPLEVRYEE